MNAISLRTRVEPCICATDSSRWITPDSLRSSICPLLHKHRHETPSIRAERKLENRSGANALESDALNTHRPRGDHWHYRRDVDGHRSERDLYRFRQKHGSSRRRRLVRDAMAVEASRRLVELPGPQKDQN